MARSGWRQALERLRRRCLCGEAPLHGATLRLLCSFWVLGLLNNSAYVICLALASEIANGGVGLVYLAAIAPTILVKATVPLWFHAVPADTRMATAAALMAAAYCAIAFSSGLGPQLAGVAVVALQGGLGEATVLALCARHPPVDTALTAWSSGTGAAGVFGYLWVAALRAWAGLSLRATLLIANLLPVAWLAAYFGGLRGAAAEAAAAAAVGEGAGGAAARSSGGGRAAVGYGLLPAASGAGTDVGDGGPAAAAAAAVVGGLAGSRVPLPGSPVKRRDSRRQGAQPLQEDGAAETAPLVGPGARSSSGSGLAAANSSVGALSVISVDGADCSSGGGIDAAAMTRRQRFAAVLALWPYTVPLFVVYWAEYSMQSGAWSSIGFPVSSPAARREFYLYSNWTYQAAVFLSRSSGTLVPIGRRGLWAMPAAQTALLAFFVANAATRWWYGWGLLSLCFVAGLLGGATYVNAFTLLSSEVAPGLREFSLAAACVADSLGIAVADVCGVLIQGCLFRANGVADEAVFRCGA